MLFNKFFRAYVLLSAITMHLMHITYATPETAPSIANSNESGHQRLVSIAAIAQNSSAVLDGTNTPDLSTTQLSELSGCKTLLGKQYLTNMLAHQVSPEDTSEIIANRQSCIKALVENPELKQEIEQYLTQAREQEQEIIILFSDFFIGNACPEIQQLDLIKQQSPLFLNTYRTGKTIQLAHASLSLATESAVIAICANGLLKSWNCKCSDCKEFGPYIALGACLFGTSAALDIRVLYKDYLSGSQKRVKMHALNRLIAIAENTETLCANNNMQKQFKLQDINTKEGISLIKGLKHSRYAAKNTKVFDLPAVHSFLYTLYNHQDHLALLFASIAELDAYNALATKELESQQTK